MCRLVIYYILIHAAVFYYPLLVVVLVVVVVVFFGIVLRQSSVDLLKLLRISGSAKFVSLEKRFYL